MFEYWNLIWMLLSFFSRSFCGMHCLYCMFTSFGHLCNFKGAEGNIEKRGAFYWQLEHEQLQSLQAPPCRERCHAQMNWSKGQLNTKFNQEIWVKIGLEWCQGYQTLWPADQNRPTMGSNLARGMNLQCRKMTEDIICNLNLFFILKILYIWLVH